MLNVITELSIRDLIVLIIAVEAVTEILTKSELFKPVRLVFSPVDDFCPYCISVWIAFYFIFFMPLSIFFAYVFAIHRLANVFHKFVDYIGIFQKKPFVGVITLHTNDLNKNNDLTK